MYLLLHCCRVDNDNYSKQNQNKPDQKRKKTDRFAQSFVIILYTYMSDRWRWHTSAINKRCAGAVYLWFDDCSSRDRDDNNITSVILKLVIYGPSRTRRVHLGFKGFSLLLFSRSINYPSVAPWYCFFLLSFFFLRWLLSDVLRRRRRERHHLCTWLQTGGTYYTIDDECPYSYRRRHSEPIGVS